jgi:hypothetical protein
VLLAGLCKQDFNGHLRRIGLSLIRVFILHLDYRVSSLQILPTTKKKKRKKTLPYSMAVFELGLESSQNIQDSLSSTVYDWNSSILSSYTDYMAVALCRHLTPTLADPLLLLLLLLLLCTLMPAGTLIAT